MASISRSILPLLDSQPEPRSMAITDTHIYWTSCGLVPGCVDGSVQFMLKDGTNPTQIAGNLESPDALAIADSNVYWAFGDGGSGTIQRAPLGGGSVTPLVTIAEDIGGIAVTAQYLLWTTEGSGSVVRADLSGNNPFTLASGPWSGSGIAAREETAQQQP